MKNAILATLVFAASAAIIEAQAQAPSPGAATPPERPEASAPAPPQRPDASITARSESFTVQGCVQKSAAAPSSPSGTPGAVGTAGASTYTLSNAARPPASSGPAAAGGAAAIAPSYRLDADDAKLSGHVGHKVEITGTLDDRAGSAAGSPNATASGMAPKLKVESVKMIAAVCQ